MNIPKLGIRMDGVEKRFIELMLDKARSFPAAQPLRFFEIGTAEGITFGALCGVMNQSGLTTPIMVSCDLPPGQSWSTDSGKLTSNLNKSGMIWVLHDGGMPRPLPRAQVYLTDGRALIQHLYQQYGFSPDFTFIDACHGSKCVTKDFLAVEPTVKSGALVVFHDASLPEQGTDWQGHCQEFITVRKALQELGLLTGQREGWCFVEEIKGDRDRGGEGNGCVVVQKI